MLTTDRHEKGLNPKEQPVVACPILPALPAAVLSLHAIRQAFQDPVDWRVEPLFAQAFVPDGDGCGGARHAAVLVPLVQRGDGLRVLLTRRAANLRHHAGQISFPGGCIEPVDRTPVDTALRETEEEIGVAPQFVDVIGIQPALLTTSHFLMTPVVGELQPGFQLLADVDEVAEVFEVPLAVLMDPAQYRLHRFQTDRGHGRYFFSVQWQSYFIWGATAILIRNLYHFLAASFSAKMRT